MFCYAKIGFVYDAFVGKAKAVLWEVLKIYSLVHLLISFTQLS